MLEHRYEERDATYMLRSWKDGIEHRMQGDRCDLPDWLDVIVRVAKIGNYAHPIACPPPDLILWFWTDDAHTLLEFISFLKLDANRLSYQYELEGI